MRCKLSKNQPTGLCFLLFAMIQTWTYLYSSKESLQRWRIQTYQQNILFFNLLMWRLAILQTSWKRVTVDERRRQNEKFKQTVAVTTASPRRTSRAVVTSSPISKQTNFLFSPRAQDATATLVNNVSWQVAFLAQARPASPAPPCRRSVPLEAFPTCIRRANRSNEDSEVGVAMVTGVSVK